LARTTVNSDDLLLACTCLVEGGGSPQANNTSLSSSSRVMWSLKQKLKCWEQKCRGYLVPEKTEQNQGKGHAVCESLLKHSWHQHKVQILNRGLPPLRASASVVDCVLCVPLLAGRSKFMSMNVLCTITACCSSEVLLRREHMLSN